MRLHDDFIGLYDSDYHSEFYQGDDETLYDKSVKTQPEDWYYRTNGVGYSFNSRGHRCKNIEDIDLDNYILFSGCSHTMGTGLAQNHSYVHLVSNMLGLDYYNLALGGSGIDVVEHNILTWWSKINKKPRYVVLQIPDHSRYISYNAEHRTISPRGTWSSSDDDWKFVASAEESGMYYARKALTYELIKNVVDVPLFTFNFANQVNYGSEYWGLRCEDYARDLCHGGIKTNEKIANHVCTRIQEFNRKI